MKDKNVFIMSTVSLLGIGSFGVLENPDRVEVGKTCEQDWEDNKQSISCVPEGLYELIDVKSLKYGNRLHLYNPHHGVTVDGPSQRTHCMFHPANYPNELEGCIALGSAWMGSQWGVANSTATTKLFQDQVKFVQHRNKGKAFLRIIRQHV